MTTHQNPTNSPASKPPEPPDDLGNHMAVDTPQKLTYSKILRDKTHILRDYQHHDTIEKSPEFLTTGDDGSIALTLEDKLRSYVPWKHSITLKVVGKNSTISI